MAETVFEQLKAFGGYSFATLRGHAAAFAVLVYQSAWLKRHHPAAFLAALLNHQPMGFWSPAVLVGDARRRGLAVLPVDIHRSRARCAVEGDGVRLGFNYVKGLGEASIDRLEAAAQTGPVAGPVDFCRRTRLPRRLVENLILAGAFDGWEIPRRRLLWQLGQLHYREEELDLVFPVDEVDLPRLSRAEALTGELEVLGLSTGEHVLALYRPWLASQGILGSRALGLHSAGERVRVAGLTVVHQAPPTAKGFHFLTLEDEAGLIDVIVRPQVYARYRRILRTAPVLIVEGTVQQEDGGVNLLARVRAALRRKPKPAASEFLRSGDLSLDLVGRRVYKAEQELNLSTKEFDLLAALMRNQGTVLSRDLLLTTVWGYDYIGESRTVDVHIRWLREKIEEEPSKPTHITTIRGIGYRFEG